MCKNNRLLDLLCCVLLLLSFNCFAEEISLYSAIGYGTSEEDAKNDSLDNLSRQLYTKVQTSTQTTFKDNGSNSSSTLNKNVLIESELPLLGVIYKTESPKGKNKEYIVTATLRTNEALTLYKKEIDTVIKYINSDLHLNAKASENQKENIYTELYSLYAQYQKLYYVAKAIGLSPISEPELSVSSFNIEYNSNARKVTSLAKAASFISESLLKQNKGSRIFVNPAFYENNNTVTPFASSIASNIKSLLGSKVALELSKGDSYLYGTYILENGQNKDDLILTYYLCAKDGTVLTSCPAVKIPYSVYSEYKYIPSNYDLQNEIENGRVSSTDFNVSLRVNGNKTALTFRGGDTVEVEVKASHPCYIYCVDYVYTDSGESYAYLFPLEPYADGKEMFARKIGPNDVNKWVVLNPSIDGEIIDIEIAPPYGEETLQVYASTTSNFEDFIESIPNFIETEDYYVITGKPVDVVAKTRALAVKKAVTKATSTVQTTESNISYSTHK